jgi:hypothetical protein
MTGLVNRRKSSTEKTSYNIIFKNVVFDYYMSLGRVIDIENNPFTLEISQGQKILLLEKNDIAR